MYARSYCVFKDIDIHPIFVALDTRRKVSERMIQSYLCNMIKQRGGGSKIEVKREKERERFIIVLPRRQK